MQMSMTASKSLSSDNKYFSLPKDSFASFLEKESVRKNEKVCLYLPVQDKGHGYGTTKEAASYPLPIPMDGTLV